MAWCGNCGTELNEGKKFCANCGEAADSGPLEATTWRLPNRTAPQAEQSRPTSPVSPGPIAPPVEPPYNPQPVYYATTVPSPYAPYSPPAPSARISLGDWLSDGWKVYKENWVLMSLATFLGALLSLCTLGILSGPLVMGLFRMAFKTMRGERPVMGDLFDWRGRFLQAFLAALIFGAIHIGISSIGGRSQGLSGILSFVIVPFLTAMFGFTMPLIQERGLDVARAINEAWRLVFSRDALMWWVVGLVFATISAGGFFGCGVGVFLTLPWMICSAAVAYTRIFGFDDPNRTLH